MNWRSLAFIAIVAALASNFYEAKTPQKVAPAPQESSTLAKAAGGCATSTIHALVADVVIFAFTGVPIPHFSAAVAGACAAGAAVGAVAS